MPIDFPDNPSLTPSYTYTYGGVTQFWEWGFRGGSGVSAWIAKGYGVTGGQPGSQGFQGFQGNTGSTGVQGRQGPTGVPAGNDREIQYKIGNSFSANSNSTISSNTSLNPSAGYSGNFLRYSESVFTDNTGLITSTQTKSITFGDYNIYTLRDLKINAGVTLTLDFSTPSIGNNLTLILGYTGGNGSNIKIPSNENIFWSGGPPGDSGGQTGIITTDTTTRKYDIIYFFSDGTNLYGNYVGDYRKT